MHFGWLVDGAACCSSGATRCGAASEVPLLENVERGCCRFTREEGSLFHFHDSSTARARRAAGSRSSSVSARARQRRCPWPLSQSSPYFVEANSARHNTRRFYTSSRHDGGDTRYMPARVHARTHAHVYGRRILAATHARGPTPKRTKKTRGP